MIKVVNKGEKEAELYITGAILDDEEGAWLASWGEDTGYVFPEKVKNELATLKGKDLTIYINSDGGSVPAGVAISSMLARHDGHTKAVVDGWACSIATQIFFSAKERAMPSNAYLMIHKPSVIVDGNADEMRKTAEVLDVIQEGLETTYRKAAIGGVSDSDIHKMVNEETWLTGAQAAEYFDVQILEPVEIVAKRGKRHVVMNHVPSIHIIDEGEDDTVYPPEVTNKEEQYFKEKAAVAVALAKGATIT